MDALFRFSALVVMRLIGSAAVCFQAVKNIVSEFADLYVVQRGFDYLLRDARDVQGISASSAALAASALVSTSVSPAALTLTLLWLLLVHG
ncbi:MAG: hypothetical protein HYW81_01405 [Parcubacteria group bacterium]|nr:hypothetical protein [Parcubacteria group bacterium]